LEQALSLLAFPKTLGEINGEPLVAAFGRFGPYMKAGETSVSLGNEDLLTLTYERAVELFTTAKERKAAAAMPLKNTEVGELVEKIESRAIPLNKLADVKAGLQAYEVGKGTPAITETMKDERVYHSAEKKDDSYYKYLDGRDVQRYSFGWSGDYLKYGNNLSAPRNFHLFSTPRILVRQIPSQPPYCIPACYTEETILNDRNSMNVVNIKDDPLFLLGVLNSKIITFWFIHKFGKLQRGIFPQFKINELDLDVLNFRNETTINKVV
jgi:hypothetical protein